MPQRAGRPTDRVRRALGSFRTTLQAPRLEARQVEWSLLSSADDLLPRPDRDLIEVALDASRLALDVDLASIAARSTDSLDRAYAELWPGEHYRLLVALCQRLEPRLVVEVGTATGMSALALLHGGARRVVSFDIVPWTAVDRSVLREEDFGSRLEQRLDDLADEAAFARHRDVLDAAELFFIDGPKDGVFEPRFLEQLVPLVQRTRAMLVLDDVRLLPMVAEWRKLDLPKLDITSFGHWSGTGIARARQDG